VINVLLAYAMGVAEAKFNTGMIFLNFILFQFHHSIDIAFVDFVASALVKLSLG